MKRRIKAAILLIGLIIGLEAQVKSYATETKSVSVTLDASNKDTEKKLIEGKISGIKITKSPGKKLSGERISNTEVEAVFIYEDSYSDGKSEERVSEEKVKSFVLSQEILADGNNTITVTEKESGNEYKTFFICFGNYVIAHEKSGINVRYGYENLDEGSFIDKNYVDAKYVYTDTYADGTKKSYTSDESVNSFTIDKTTVEGKDTVVTVREYETGQNYESSFVIKGTENKEKGKNEEPGYIAKEEKAETTTSNKSTATSSTNTEDTKVHGELTEPGMIESTKSSKNSKDSSKKDKETEEKEEETKGYILIKEEIDGVITESRYFEEDKDYAYFEDLESIFKELIDEEDEELRKEGVLVYLELNITDKVLLSDTKKSLIMDSLDNNEYIGKILDISLFKYADENVKETYKTLDNGMILTLNVPENMIKENLRYQVLMIYEDENGKEIIEHLEDLDDNGETITFEVKRFATYVLTYKEEDLIEPEEIEEEITEEEKTEEATETVAEEIKEEPTNEKSLPVELIALPILGAALGGIGFYVIKKKKEEDGDYDELEEDEEAEETIAVVEDDEYEEIEKEALPSGDDF